MLGVLRSVWTLRTTPHTPFLTTHSIPRTTTYGFADYSVVLPWQNQGCWTGWVGLGLCEWLWLWWRWWCGAGDRNADGRVAIGSTAQSQDDQAGTRPPNGNRSSLHDKPPSLLPCAMLDIAASSHLPRSSVPSARHCGYAKSTTSFRRCERC